MQISGNLIIRIFDELTIDLDRLGYDVTVKHEAVIVLCSKRRIVVKKIGEIKEMNTEYR
jgi:hypothetical protein